MHSKKKPSTSHVSRLDPEIAEIASEIEQLGLGNGVEENRVDGFGVTYHEASGHVFIRTERAVLVIDAEGETLARVTSNMPIDPFSRDYRTTLNDLGMWTKSPALELERERATRRKRRRQSSN